MPAHLPINPFRDNLTIIDYTARWIVVRKTRLAISNCDGIQTHASDPLAES